VEECVLQGGEGASCAATGCQLSCSVSPGSINSIAIHSSFPFMCGRVGDWAAEHGSNPVQTCQVVQMKSVSCKGVEVQVVLLQAAWSWSVSAGSINTLQNITRFHLCVAEWVLGQLSMGPTLFRPVRLSSEECVLQRG